MGHDKKTTPTQGDSDVPYAVQVDVPLTPPGNPEGGAVFTEEEQIQVGKWETGLWCGCLKDCVPNCCMVSFCPCISLAQISARLDMASYGCALVTLLLLLVFTCGTAHVIVFVWIWKARALTRERFQIPGSCCGDCCASLCCPCCTLAQTATHIKSYKPGSCDFGPQDTLPAYNKS